MIHEIKTHFVIKNSLSGLFWNDQDKVWANTNDRLDVLILSIADDQDSQDEIEKEYKTILNNIAEHEKGCCSLDKIITEIKIIF